jgi:hypothetical protein
MTTRSRRGAEAAAAIALENFFLASAKTPASPSLLFGRARDNPPVNPTDPGLPGAEATPRPTLNGVSRLPSR